MKKKICALIIVAIISMLFPNVYAKAEEKERYYIGNIVSADEEGYTGNRSIKEDDIHYGWKLGEFYVEGFTQYEKDVSKDIVFLKNVGDEVILWFDLQEDIDELNGNEDLYICEDDDGYYEKYGIEKTNFERGTLIIRYTDYQNKKGEPQIYTNYLAAKTSEKADTKVILCEEGDYEVTLLYEVYEDGFLFVNSSSNYKIEFKFSVRNGNTMVFPFDVKTKQELSNSSFTENGFYLDFANSRYLAINIKREVLKDGTEGLVEDVRFNRPVSDGEEYTEEGIYTITARNQYTGGITEKKIYVGTNSILKAHIVTGLGIEEIKKQVSNGAQIDENGNINIKEDDLKKDEKKDAEKTDENSKVEIFNIIVCSIVVIMISGIIIFFVRKRFLKTAEEE